MEKHIGKTHEQLLDRLRQEPNIPAASTFHDRATAELAISNVINENKNKIKKLSQRKQQPTAHHSELQRTDRYQF